MVLGAGDIAENKTIWGVQNGCKAILWHGSKDYNEHNLA